MTDEIYDNKIKQEIERYSVMLQHYEKFPLDIEENQDKISEAVEGISKLHHSEAGHKTIKFKDKIEETRDGLSKLLEELRLK